MASEKRLIDANAMKHKICETCNSLCSDEPCEPSECYSMEYIDKLPTVDAVEVVRCKDCKYFYRHTQIDTDRGDCWCYGFGSLRVKHIDDYCSSGERRTHEFD